MENIQTDTEIDKKTQNFYSFQWFYSVLVKFRQTSRIEIFKKANKGESWLCGSL